MNWLRRSRHKKSTGSWRLSGWLVSRRNSRQGSTQYSWRGTSQTWRDGVTKLNERSRAAEAGIMEGSDKASGIGDGTKDGL